MAELRTELEKQYRSTAFCACLLYEEDRKLRSRYYCGYRWCLVCNRIRSARAIDRYRPVLANWRDRCFVTLTLPNVCGDDLRDTIAAMLSAMPRIARAIRRTDRLEVRALRKLECTYNTIREDFHPHLHIIVEGRSTAEALVRRWLLEFPTAVAAAQDIRQCDDRDIVEAMKYFTKLTSKVRGKRAISDVRALDQIFRAMKGKRVFQPMGFRSLQDVDADSDEADLNLDSATPAPTVNQDSRTWEWSQLLTDWVDYASGEVLSGYQPTPRMCELVASILPPDP